MIYGTGTLVFWPAAVLTSWPAFLVTNFIIGLGLSTLELAANPFIALCGPAEFAEVRLNLSQGFQACGTVFATVLAKKALFNNVHDAASLIDVQWTYLAISLFTFILAFVYYSIKLPEVTDDELEDATEQNFPDSLQGLRKTKVIWATLGLAALSQFCYVGAQESIATSLDSFIVVVEPGADPVNYEAVGQTFFAVSRFISAFAGFFTTPRIHLAFFYAGAILFSTLAVHFRGFTGSSMVMCAFFFEGPLFSIIYAMPLRCLGKYTKDSSAVLAAAISGGSLFSAVMHAVSVRGKRPNGVQYSYCVTVAAFAFGSLFPIYANLVPQARRSVDPPRRPQELRDRPLSIVTSIGQYLVDVTSKKARNSKSLSSEEKDSNKRHRSQDISNPVSGQSGSSDEPNTQPSIESGVREQEARRSSQTKRHCLRQTVDSAGIPMVTDFATARNPERPLSLK